MFARVAVCFFLVLFAGAAFAEDANNRVALVIGNSAYKRSALANPVNDAKLMAAKLKAQGFEVFASYDAGQRDMKRAVQGFSATLRERGKDVVAFIFYAGHGVQVKGENYLIPVDEQIKSEADVDIDAVSLSSIMSMLENTQTRLAIVVLDACRDNPFGYARGGQRGLARVDAPSGSLVAFSTAPSKAALDGPDGGNSYFTAALAQAMAEPGLKIEEVFKKVRIAVREKTKGEQTPWESTSLTGDFYPAGEKVTAPEIEYEDRAQRLVRTFVGHKGSIPSIAFSPDGRQLASGSRDMSLKLWDLSSGNELRNFAGHTGEVYSVAFSPDGRTLASASFDKTLKLWDVASGRELRTFTGHTDWVRSVVFSPDGRQLASGGGDMSLKLWDMSSGRELRSLTGHASWVTAVAFSPDGRQLASGSSDNTLKLWEAASGKELRAFKGHTNWIYSAVFSPDGRQLVSGSVDKTFKLWEVSSGKELRSFAGHASYVQSAVFSPDARYLLSGSCAVFNKKNSTCTRGSIKLWAADTGQELHEFTGHTDDVGSVAFSADGRFVLSGSNDRTLKLWDVSEWTQPQEARR